MNILDTISRWFEKRKEQKWKQRIWHELNTGHNRFASRRVLDYVEGTIIDKESLAYFFNMLGLSSLAKTVQQAPDGIHFIISEAELEKDDTLSGNIYRIRTKLSFGIKSMDDEAWEFFSTVLTSFQSNSEEAVDRRIEEIREFIESLKIPNSSYISM